MHTHVRKLFITLLALVASCGGAEAVTPKPVVEPPVVEPPLVIPAFPELSTQEATTLTEMLKVLPAQISSSATSNAAAVDRNPGLASYLDGKVAMLKQPGLGQAIVDGRRFSTTSVPLLDGRTLPIAIVFPLDTMRTLASAKLPRLARVLPRVEGWYAMAYPASALRLWYGFVLGSSGGAGVINLEDEGTYLARTPSTRMPHDAILFHELAHGYTLHESLTQFVELYLYNREQAASEDPTTWSHSRGWIPQAAGNTGVQALLDVYQLIGSARMMAAYRAVQPLHVSYGVTLPAAAQQAFVDAAPAEMKPRVAELMARVGT